MASLLNAMTGEILIERLEIADSFWRRFLGLQFRSRLLLQQGLWLTPCSSIHTCFMRFTIDVIMVDSEMRVIAIHRGIKPWRFLIGARPTHSILEVSEAGHSFSVGLQLTIAQ